MERKPIRSFCYEGQILLIQNNKVIEEIPYCKVLFLRILNTLWHRKKTWPSADCLVKEAIEEYAGAKLRRLYNDKVLSDDELFLKLRDMVKAKYASTFSVNQQERHEKFEKLHEYQRECGLRSEDRRNSIKRHGGILRAR